MKTNLELLIMIIYTTHALPIRNPVKEAQNTRKDSADASQNVHTLSEQSIKQLRLNFLTGLQNVMDDWKKSREKSIFSDPSSKIKRLHTTGRSRIKDTTKVMKLTDSQIRQIKENYNTNLTDTEIKMLEKETEETNLSDKGISGRSKNHNEPTSDIYIWSSNALTEEQWDTIQNNVQENDEEIKYIYDDVEKELEKYDNHTSKNADGRHRIVNTKNVTEESKYYSFSKSEWEKLKHTLHKHLIGEDEKILKVNEDPSGRNRNEEVESPNLPKWSIWSSYALKPSEWDQLKQNIHHNEFIMNKTQNNIDPVGRGRSNEGDFSINGYDNAPSAADHINAVIVKPVTGERLYNLRNNFDWDRLLESISSKDINKTDEGKEDISIVDGSVGYNNQSNDTNEKRISESQMGRSRKIGRQRQVIGIMPSLVLDDDDDENIPNFEDIGSEPLFIGKDITVGVDENNFASNKSTSISIQENDVNIQNTEQTAINFLSDSPGSELKNNINTFTPSPIYLTEGILDYDTTAPFHLKSNTSRENYIFQQSVESDNSASTIAHETSDTEKYVTESVGYVNSTRENYIFQQSVVSDNSTSIKSYDTTDAEMYDSTELAEFYNSTRETYIKIKPVTDSTEIMDYSTRTQNKDSNIHDTTVINDTLTVNALNLDVTQYTNIYDHTTEQDYSINNTSMLNNIESEYTPINDNTTSQGDETTTSTNDTINLNNTESSNMLRNESLINLSEFVTTEDYKRTLITDIFSSDTLDGSTTSQGDETTTSTNDTIYLIDTESSNMLRNESFINLSEFVNTEDYKRTLITDIFSSDTLDNVTDSLLDNYSSPPIQNYISTVSQAYESTTEGNNYGLFGFFGLFDKSNSKITTNGINDQVIGIMPSLVLDDDENIPNFEDIGSVMDPSTTTDSSLSVIIDDDGYVVKENRFDIPIDILLSTTTEVLLGDNDTFLIFEKDTSLKNKDLALNLTSQEIMMDKEMSLPTTDSLDSISEYFFTTNSEELGAVLLNSDSVPTSIQNPLPVNDSLSTVDLENNKSTTNVGFEIEKTTLNNLNISDLGEISSSDMTTTVDLISEETRGSTVQFHNYNLNISSDVNNQSEDPKNEVENLDTTFIPSSSADISENMSIKSSSEILSTTQNMETNEVGIYSATEKLPNEQPNQPQELVGNEIPDISTTARPTTIELTPVEPVSNNMPTWIILLIVLVLSLIVIAVGFVVVLRLKRQTGHVQLSP